MRDIIFITTVYHQNFVEPLADLLWILMIFFRRNLPLCSLFLDITVLVNETTLV